MQSVSCEGILNDLYSYLFIYLFILFIYLFIYYLSIYLFIYFSVNLLSLNWLLFISRFCLILEISFASDWLICSLQWIRLISLKILAIVENQLLLRSMRYHFCLRESDIERKRIGIRNFSVFFIFFLLFFFSDLPGERESTSLVSI
jgi:hypothetical protein